MPGSISNDRASEILRKDISDFDERFYRISLMRENGRLVGLKLGISPLGNSQFKFEDYSSGVRRAYARIRAEDAFLRKSDGHNDIFYCDEPMELLIDFCAQSLVLSTNGKEIKR